MDSRLKHEFLGLAEARQAHELRNAVAQACVALTLARRSLLRDEVEATAAMLEEAHRAADHCRRLLAGTED